MSLNYRELHPAAWQHLLKLRQRLPHALLFTGQPGLGKLDIALAYAASLLCEQPRGDGLACGGCSSCHWLEQGNHPDFRLLQPAALSQDDDGEGGEAPRGDKKASRQITIDQVRGLAEFLNVGTHRQGLRLIVINPAEAMNRATANALLKTLEEPGPNTLFLLVSGEAARLLPTIRSRCQRVGFVTPTAALASRALAAAGVKEAEMWLALAGGAPKLAQGLAESGRGGWLGELVRHLAAGGELDPFAAALSLEKLVKDPKSGLVLPQLLEWVLKWVVDLNLAVQDLPVRYFSRQQDKIAALSRRLPALQVLRFYRSLLEWRRDAEQPLNPRLLLETLFLQYRALYG
ncbi:MAG: hypothetical protein RIR00_620 [Pseudomonadota bacterium]|jgi:DNA polymerase-3 subunit delta'